MFLMRMAALAVITTGVLNLAPSAAAVVIKGTGSLSSSEFMQETVLRDMIADSTVGHAMQRRDAVHRCYEPASEVVSSLFIKDGSMKHTINTLG